MEFRKRQNAGELDRFFHAAVSELTDVFTKIQDLCQQDKRYDSECAFYIGLLAGKCSLHLIRCFAGMNLHNESSCKTIFLIKVHKIFVFSKK